MYQVDRTDFMNQPILVDMSKTKKQAGLVWVGQYYSRYGEVQHENQLRLLENFAGPNEPGYQDDAGLAFNHVQGQLWYHTSDSDHLGGNILKVYDKNTFSGTNGWKRVEVIISEDQPTVHAEGELNYKPTTHELFISRGTFWESVSVTKALDSELLNGLDSTQFLRSDVNDIMNGNLQVNNVTPNINLAYSLGTSSKRWDALYVDTLDTNDVHHLIPEMDDTYKLGDVSNSTALKRWAQVNAVTGNFVTFNSDVTPTNSDNNTLGESSNRWLETHTRTLYTLYSDTILPIDGTKNLGSPAYRWDTLYASQINVSGFDDLLPNQDNTYDIGSASLRWKDLYVNTIKATSTETLIPNGAGIYDLGNSSNHYRDLYFNNIGVDIHSDGDISFDIVQNGNSKGIAWTGLTDAHKIFVEEYNNTENTILVFDTGDNASGADYAEFRHTGVRKLIVKDNIVDVEAGTLRTKGDLKVEDPNSGNGCQMYYDNSTNTLEFVFY